MTVHFVGAGPGAADLLTLRAAEVLQNADVCLYAGTYLDAGVLDHCRPDARLVDTQHLDLDGIIAEIVAAHADGLDVARLCSGDPSIYSALAEQTRRLDAAGIPWDVVPGVPAYAAARLGVELTVPRCSRWCSPRAGRRRAAGRGSGELRRHRRHARAAPGHHADPGTRRAVDDHGADCPVAVVANANRPTASNCGARSPTSRTPWVAGLRQAAVILVRRA